MAWFRTRRGSLDDRSVLSFGSHLTIIPFFINFRFAFSACFLCAGEAFPLTFLSPVWIFATPVLTYFLDFRFCMGFFYEFIYTHKAKRGKICVLASLHDK
jgi:hypothetical protein